MNDGINQQETDIASFFSVLQAKRESFADFMRLYETSIAPRFNLFDFIGPDENKLSEIIAFLLNPEEAHGQGCKFLHIFLEAIGQSAEDGQNNAFLQKFLESIKNKLNSSTKVTCTLEKATDKIETTQRRIDIELKVGNFGLAIENKPWACDQVEQIAAYNKQLEKDYKKTQYLLIYLSGAGEPPSKESIPEEDRKELIKSGHLKIFSYREFIPCVNQFKTHCQSERVRCFLQDFENYLKKRFEGGMGMYEKDMMMKYVLSDSKDSKNLEIALAVSQIQDDIKQKLWKDLKGILEQNRPNQLKLDWGINNFWGYKDTGFSFKKDTWQYYNISFEFEQGQGCGFSYGVMKDEENQPNIDEIRDDDKLGVGKHNSRWPWYQKFEPYCDWRSSHEPWVDIFNGGGKLKELILKEVNRITEVLDQIEFHANDAPSFRKNCSP